MTALQLVEVRRADTDLECRTCNQPIRAGQRAALVLGTGWTHLRCLLTLTETQRRTADERALSTRCPSCDAKPGDTCRRPNGQPAPQPHRYRYTAAHPAAP